MNKVKELEKAIQLEKQDCVKWYKDYLINECDIDKKNLSSSSKVYEAMKDLEPDNEFENMQFSAGFILGMERALFILNK